MDEIHKMGDTLVQEARERTRGITDDVLEKSRTILDEAKQKGQTLWDDAQKLVRDYPGAAIGVALLAGTIVGVLIGLRNDD